MQEKLMKYIPKEYKPYVADIEPDEKVWNEVTNKWNTTIKVTWKIDGDTETKIYQNASWMYFVLKDQGCEFIDKVLSDNE